MNITKIKEELNKHANPAKAKTYSNFHKTDSKGYAKGEKFLGVTVPNIRKIALNNLNLSYAEILKLLKSNIHEEKYVAAEALAGKYASSLNKKEVFDFYIRNASKISGWDLVDTTASQIAGNYLLNREKKILYKLAKSDSIWERRISIIATYYFIKNNEFKETLKIAEILLKDKHDLIQKAVGWMLREVGKRDSTVLKAFLKKHYKEMPRTMLRYAIERFTEKERKTYLKRER